LFFVDNDLGRDHLAAAVITVGADVVAQMGFAGDGITRNGGALQGVVRTAHAAAGRRLATFLNSHRDLPQSVFRFFSFFSTATGFSRLASPASASASAAPR